MSLLDRVLACLPLTRESIPRIGRKEKEKKGNVGKEKRGTLFFKLD